MQDHFTGVYKLIPNGYILRRKLLFRHPVPLQTFINDPVNPLTFHLENGDTIQPFRRFDGYDRGSVPLIFQGVVSPNFGEKATINHDSVFEFHAWWYNGKMVEVTLWQANNMLYRMARAEYRQIYEECTKPKTTWIGKKASKTWGWLEDKNNRVVNGLAWFGVMAGGIFPWKKKDYTTIENLRRDVQAHLNKDNTLT